MSTMKLMRLKPHEAAMHAEAAEVLALAKKGAHFWLTPQGDVTATYVVTGHCYTVFVAKGLAPIETLKKRTTHKRRPKKRVTVFTYSDGKRIGE